MALKAGEVAPDFKLPAALGDKQEDFQLSTHRGKNVVLLFYALDFTPVCSAELPIFQADIKKFSEFNAVVVGICTDTVPSHIAFQKSLGGISFPLAADRWPYGKVAQAYGLFPPQKHQVPFINDRAAFVVDKAGKIAWARVYELKEQPDAGEILGVLRKLA